MVQFYQIGSRTYFAMVAHEAVHTGTSVGTHATAAVPAGVHANRCETYKSSRNGFYFFSDCFLRSVQ